MRSWTVTDLARPRSLNAERSGHWRKHRAETNEEVERWGWLWRAALPPGLHLARIDVEAAPSYKSRPQDTGNCYPSVKAAIDALVSLGVIPDDTGTHVAAITMHAPDGTLKADSLTITIQEAP